jgi:hypothetical protein
VCNVGNVRDGAREARRHMSLALELHCPSPWVSHTFLDCIACFSSFKGMCTDISSVRYCISWGVSKSHVDQLLDLSETDSGGHTSTFLGDSSVEI